MTKPDPRTRLLLRQADKIATAGKRSAAVELYEKIIEETPDVDSAWVGLAAVLDDSARAEEAYQKALTLNPDNEAAQRGLAILRGEFVPQAPVVEEVVEETAVSTPIPEEIEPPTQETDLLLSCYRHPGRETGLRCYNCNNPICMDCTRKTPVGYICPDCYREKEDIFFNAKTRDYFIAPLIAFPLSLIVGFIVAQFNGGIFLFFIAFAVGGAVGSGIGRLAKRAVGNRRGRYLPQTVAAMLILGIMLPALPLLLSGAIFSAIMPLLLTFSATGAAIYAMK